jgi:hypothetical protein
MFLDDLVARSELLTFRLIDNGLQYVMPQSMEQGCAFQNVDNVTHD